MKKIVIIFFCTVCLSSTLHAQVSLGYKLGYGTYRMQSVAEFQQYVLDGSDLPGEIVEQFPGYLNHRLYLGLPSRWPQYKAYLGYVTTAGRISLVDYSGKWNFDMLLNGFQAGLHWESAMKMMKKIELKCYLDFGATTSTLNMYEYIKVWDEESQQSQLFIAYGLDIQGGFEAFYKLPFINIGCYLGYEQDFSTAFHVEGNRDAKLGISDSNLTHPGWAGLRTGMSISYTFGKKK
jgi:hypothetical protein